MAPFLRKITGTHYTICRTGASVIVTYSDTYSCWVTYQEWVGNDNRHLSFSLLIFFVAGQKRNKKAGIG